MHFIPFLWAKSSEQALMGRLKEVFLQLGEELKEVPVCDLPQRVADNIASQGQLKKSWRRTQGMTDAARTAIEAVNASGGREQYSMAHLAEPCPQGEYRYVPDTEVWDTQRLATAWGTVRLAIRAAQRTAAAAAED